MSSAISKVVGFIKHGMPDATEKQVAERLAKCLGCKSRRQYWGGESCGTFLHEVKDGSTPTCGCDINEKVKFKDEKCPQNKW